MNNLQKQIFIAEKCGITVENCTCAGGLVKRDAKTKRHLLDYLGSLDAMAEAEKALTPERKLNRVTQLCKICDRDYGNEIAPSDVYTPLEMASMFLDCTPAQRAEAFIACFS